MSFKIVTDSSANLSHEIVEKFDLHVLTMAYVMADGTENLSFVKGQNFNYEEFYKHLRSKSPLSTSQVTVEQALENCRAFLEDGQDVLYIGFSSALSGSFGAVSVALNLLKDEFPSRKVLMVDSLSATMGVGLLVMEAAAMREEGRTIEETHAWVDENRHKVLHFFTVDDLFYLKRGGRMSATKALMGTALNIKPVLTVNSAGKLVPIGKAKGRKKALEEIADKTVEFANSALTKNKIYIAHVDVDEDAQYTAKHMKAKNLSLDVEIVKLDPVISVHTGPGVVAVICMSSTKAREQ